MIRRNKFEMAAHDIQFKDTNRPSWDHTIETYTEPESCGHDWFLYIATAGIIIFGLVALKCI